MNSILDSTPEDLDFLTGECTVRIVPSVHLNVMELMSGQIGPFRPNYESTVPLWLAIHLKNSKKCKMLAPHCLDEGYLREKLTEEKGQPALGTIDFKLFCLFKLYER